MSYSTILRVVKSLSHEAIASVTAAGRSQNSVTVYDNFEQMEGVREQRVEGNSTFHSVTAGEVFEGREMPDGGLRQTMLDPNVRLEPESVLLAPGNSDDEIQRQV